MAELEDVTLDGKPLHSLRVADLKTALEERGLAKSGQKNALIKRLKGALMLENLQRSSTCHSGIQPNSQIGEEMSQNSFIKQYLAKQQELLRQRLEREAREATEADESQSPAGPEEDDNDSTSFLLEKHHIAHAHLSAGGGLPQDPGLVGSQKLDTGPVPVSQESSDSKAGRIWHPSFPSGHEDVATPSPPRAVASLSVRVVGQPERQGLPPRSQEREGTAPVEAGPAHSMLQLSRSARAAGGAQVDSDDDDDEEDDDDSEDDDEWGPASHGKKNVRAPPARAPPAAAPQRSRRKLQPPQHIPPQLQPVLQPPLQLRQPTPPPSPPPELSFPLPDTPKQSPHDQDEPAGLAEAAVPGPGMVSPPSLTRQESSSSSRSSSPEPPSTRKPGPLSLLVRKMESEGVFGSAQNIEVKGEGDMEVEEQEHSEAAVQDSTRELSRTDVSSSVSTMPPDQQGIQDSELEKGEDEPKPSEETQNEKVDETSVPLCSTSTTTRSSRRQRIFSEVPPPESLMSPSKPEQLSMLTSISKGSEDSPMETEEFTTTPASKHKEDKELKGLNNEAPEESPKPADENKKALTSPHATSEEEKMDKTRDRSKKDKRRSSTSSQSSSSDADSESSSSHSSSSPSRDKSSPTSKTKDVEEKGRKGAEEKKAQSSREVKQEALSEPTGQVAMELEGLSHSESAVQQSDHQGADSSDSRPEESSAAKSFAARKISLSSKTEIASSESEPVGGASRKRRWGSSTAVTAKKPSISITTESLKTLIPDIKPLQEAVVDLHPDEGRLSVDEDSSGPREREEPEEDQGLKIRRTVTQIVPSDGHENGQKEMDEKDEEEDEDDEEEEQKHSGEEKEKPRKQESSPDASVETPECDSQKVTPSDSLVRRSISQQKSGVSITIDDPIRTGRQLSPPRGKTSNIIHVLHLVRPFTLGQLKLLLNRTGTMVEEGFWIDKIKSHCYVTYSTVEEAVATREALHGVKWPASNPKVLRVDFSDQDELDFHKGLISGERAGVGHDPKASGPSSRPPAAHPPIPPPNHEKEKERERDRDGGSSAVRDQWAERERAMERRERTRSEREWDRDKVKDFGREERDRTRRSRSRERRRRERGKSKEKRTEKKEKPEEPPVKLLDDLFHKTKAAPCIYWLPLTDEQATQRDQERADRIKEREKRRKEIFEEEDKKRKEREQERAKGRDRVGGNTAETRAGVPRRSTEGERDRGKGGERERGREADKRKDAQRGQRDSKTTTAAGNRRSQSHNSTSRDRRH
ncbi:apoptotic chromatin condensation inducer 1b [Danio rerio]|uniref:Apoptotic chromatin condensation inducer 1b n=2 Tax=Danio rerio TaxID=7955 RepID=F1Q511_DANRE|nr:apoptotic chromatin condensation inducer 1b [Danio rerio]|eukprot:NP_001292511.1 apoptotic chromatin condensation inducer in the nucleus [Danio rerio]